MGEEYGDEDEGEEEVRGSCNQEACAALKGSSQELEAAHKSAHKNEERRMHASARDAHNSQAQPNRHEQALQVGTQSNLSEERQTRGAQVCENSSKAVGSDRKGAHEEDMAREGNQKGHGSCQWN